MTPRRAGLIRGLLSALVLAPPIASAADFAVNAGALEVIALPPAHAGFYPYVGGSVAFPLPHLTAIVALSYEWSFDQGRGGFVLVGTADYALNSRVGLDLNVAFIHDMPGFNWKKSDLFFGVGPGCTVFLGKWAVSPYLGLFSGLTTSGWSLVPGLNVAYTL